MFSAAQEQAAQEQAAQEPVKYNLLLRLPYIVRQIAPYET